MITPIGFVLKVPKLVENTNSCSPFQGTDKIGYRYLRWNTYKEMHMINLDAEFYDLSSLLLCKYPDAAFCFFGHLTNQNLEPVCWHKNYMILAVPNCL